MVIELLKAKTIPFNYFSKAINEINNKYKLEYKFYKDKSKILNKVDKIIKKYPDKHYPINVQYFSSFKQDIRNQFLEIIARTDSALQFNFWNSTFKSTEIHKLINKFTEEFFKQKKRSYSLLKDYENYLKNNLINFFKYTDLFSLTFERIEILKNAFRFDSYVFLQDPLRKKHIFGIYLFIDIFSQLSNKVSDKEEIKLYFKRYPLEYLFPIDYRLPQALKSFCWYPENLKKEYLTDYEEKELRLITLFYLSKIYKEINNYDIYFNKQLDYSLFRYAREELNSEPHKFLTTNY